MGYQYISVLLPLLLTASSAFAQGTYYDDGRSYEQESLYDQGSGDVQGYGYDSYSNGPVEGDMTLFYDSLGPYGDWYYTPEYGYVWIPNVDHSRWRPYVDNGNWAWTEYGWTWVSNYEWGWAPFHYGRWLWLDDAYWVWIPDTVWGPAWVAWRYTDTHVGWAALPPGAYWYPDYGLEVTVQIPWRWWYFVPGARILDPYVYRYGVSYPTMKNIYYASRRATVYRIYGGVPRSVGVDVRYVHRWTGTPVRQARVSIYSAPVARAARAPGRVAIYRPMIHATTRYRAVTPPTPRRAAPAALTRIYTPPAPTRAGVAASQAYRVQATRVAAPRTAPRARQHQDLARERRDVQRSQRDVRQGRQEVRYDTREVNQDRRDVRQDRRDLGHDVRTGNTSEVRQDGRQLRQSRQDLNRSRTERARDRGDLQRDRVQRGQERRDVQRERIDRRP